MRMRGPGAVDDVFISEIVRPRWANAYKRMERSSSVGRQGAITSPLVDRVERLRDRFRVITRDGVVDLTEQAEIAHELAQMEPEAHRVHRSLRFVSLAIQGDGIDSAWFERQRRADIHDRLYLVTPEDDGPEPGAPGAAMSAKCRAA